MASDMNPSIDGDFGVARFVFLETLRIDFARMMRKTSQRDELLKEHNHMRILTLSRLDGENSSWNVLLKKISRNTKILSPLVFFQARAGRAFHDMTGLEVVRIEQCERRSKKGKGKGK